MMRELVVISGKGGTGKTSLVAAFAVLADGAVLADCDVDAADLHLILSPRTREWHEFWSGHQAVIRPELCIGCGACLDVCRFGAVVAPSSPVDGQPFSVDPLSCDGCGVCVRFCPVEAIAFPERCCGEWMVSDTRCGPLVHARLGAAAENSGKLVSAVRREARRVAWDESRPLIIVDGPPGIGCPVIASVTGATSVLAITEPTVSGEHDLGRLLALVRHFAIPAAVCVNKWDLNPGMTERIENNAVQAGVRLAGRIRYDQDFTVAQIGGRAVVEGNYPVGEDIRRIWEQLDR